MNKVKKPTVRALQSEVESLQAELAAQRKRTQAAYDECRRVDIESHNRVREMTAMLGRARDLLIHEKIAAQKEGREAGYIKLPSGGTSPVGWRLNGVSDLIATIDNALRGS